MTRLFDLSEDTTMVTTENAPDPSTPTVRLTSSALVVTNSPLNNFSEETTRITAGETQGPSTPNPPQSSSASVTDSSEGPNETGKRR